MMKFITEEYLRGFIQKRTFLIPTSYNRDSALHLEAARYLSDKGIKPQ